MPKTAAIELSIYSTEPDLPIGILSISSVPEDHVALRRLLHGRTCHYATADRCDTALQHLRRGGISIVVCDTELPDGTWRDILDYTQACPERPFLIVTSRLADGNLWAEVLNLGGFDLIAKPFDARDARHVLETACLRRLGTGRLTRGASAA